ncbi:MAG: hypothetical protein AAGB28_01300 [Pseudomonadota bacterium]
MIFRIHHFCLVLALAACGETISTIPIPHTPVGSDQVAASSPVSSLNNAGGTTYRVSSTETLTVRKIDEKTTVETYVLGAPAPAQNFATPGSGLASRNVPVYSVSARKTNAQAAADATRKSMPGKPIQYGKTNTQLRRIVVNGASYGVIKPAGYVPGPLSRKYVTWERAMLRIITTETGCNMKKVRDGGLVQGLWQNAFVIPLEC